MRRKRDPVLDGVPGQAGGSPGAREVSAESVSATGGHSSRSRRDLGITALIEGFFASAWFGWGQAEPSPLGTWLSVGSIVAVLVAIAGAVIGFRSSAAAAVLHDPRLRRRYTITVVVEFGLAALGAGLLGVLGAADFIPVWVCAVVAVHFFPLVTVLRDRLLIPLGCMMCAVAVLGLLAGSLTGVAPSLVTGAGAGSCLLLFAVLALGMAVRARTGTVPAGG